MTSNYASTGYCCPLSLAGPTLTISPSSYNMVPGDTEQYTATADMYDCNYVHWPINVTGNSSWSSSSPAVATINSTGLVTGVAGGSTSITANFSGYCYVPICQPPPCHACQANPMSASGSGSCNVQKPTSLTVLSVTTIATGATGGCTSSKNYGIRVAVKYQVMDQNVPARAIQSSKMEPQEQLLHYVFNGQNYGDIEPNWVDIGPTEVSGTSKFTGSDGTFLDAPYGTCANGTFNNTFTQPISILLGSTRYQVRNNDITVSSTSTGHGSISNGSDIAKTR